MDLPEWPLSDPHSEKHWLGAAAASSGFPTGGQLLSPRSFTLTHTHAHWRSALPPPCWNLTRKCLYLK